MARLGDDPPRPLIDPLKHEGIPVLDRQEGQSRDNAKRAEAEKWVQSHIRLMNLDSDGMSACILHRLDDKEEDP